MNEGIPQGVATTAVFADDIRRMFGESVNSLYGNASTWDTGARKAADTEVRKIIDFAKKDTFPDGGPKVRGKEEP